jgi:hypothetical protein
MGNACAAHREINMEYITSVGKFYGKRPLGRCSQL